MTDEKKNSEVSRYLQTLKIWREELERLRTILLDCPLTEELKWGKPCYTFQKNNVVMLYAFKEYSALGFFKGSLLKDGAGILTKPGENSQAMRMIHFTQVREIDEKAAVLKMYVEEAIEVEKAGLEVEFKKTSELVIPEELLTKFEELPALKTAFEKLTPGRQRGYVLYFSEPKQSKTRQSRIEKYTRQILGGRGLNDPSAS